LEKSLANFVGVAELQPDGLDFLRQSLQSLRLGPAPILSFRIEVIILPEQPIAALMTLLKTRKKKRTRKSNTKNQPV